MAFSKHKVPWTLPGDLGTLECASRRKGEKLEKNWKERKTEVTPKCKKKGVV